MGGGSFGGKDPWWIVKPEKKTIIWKYEPFFIVLQYLQKNNIKFQIIKLIKYSTNILYYYND